MRVMLRNASRLLGLCAALGGVAACTSTSRPASPAVQACTVQCQGGNDQCRAREDSGAQQCEWRRQQAQRDLDNCRANTNDAAKCTQQVPQCSAASYGQCDGQYRQCNQACGGVTGAPKQ